MPPWADKITVVRRKIECFKIYVFIVTIEAQRGVENILLLERFKPDLISMVLETYQAIREVEAVTRRLLHVYCIGCLYAAVSPEHQKNLRELAAISTEGGLKVEWLDTKAASHLLPWMRLPRDTSVVFMPEREK